MSAALQMVWDRDRADRDELRDARERHRVAAIMIGDEKPLEWMPTDPDLALIVDAVIAIGVDKMPCGHLVISVLRELEPKRPWREIVGLLVAEYTDRKQLIASRLPIVDARQFCAVRQAALDAAERDLCEAIARVQRRRFDLEVAVSMLAGIIAAMEDA